MTSSSLGHLSLFRVARLPLLLAAALLAAAAQLPAQIAPQEELKTLQTPEGIDVTLFASEPMITNPAAIDVDTHGRVWVAEIQWYRGGAKQPPADKIKVLEDTDGDGRADKVTVFADDLFAPMSICVAGDKVYVATSPDLWVYEDADGDLRADGPPRKLLTGFGGLNHDHGAHSIVLGPDHKWWMAHGDRGFDVAGTDDSHFAYQWGAVLRGELDGSQLELVAVNFRNPYEVCVSSFGEAYLSDNDNDGNESVRICWILDGGNYGWFGGPPFGKQELAARLSPQTPYREHWHFRGHVPGYVPATLVTGFGSPTGICFYEGDAFGARFKNAPLHTDAGPRLCRVFRHEPHGFGKRATSETFLSNSGDDYFRPDDVCAAPDGRLYVSDWYDGGVGGHGYNNPDQGRIFALAPAGQKLERHEKPGPYDNVADAIEGLKSPNLATQYLARQRLLDAGQGSVAALRQLLEHKEPNYRARALWVLDRIGGDARREVVGQLQSDDPAFRALAVRILRRNERAEREATLSLADDPSPEVRREVLLAAGDLPGEAAVEAIASIAASYDGTDRYLLEAINVAAADRREEVLARLESDRPLDAAQFPLLQLLAPERAVASLLAQLSDDALDEATARVLFDAAVNIPSDEAGYGLLALAADAQRPLAIRRTALERLLANVGPRGAWTDINGSPRFQESLATLLDDEALRGQALAAVGRLRLRKLGDRVVAIARDQSIKPGQRAQATRVAARLNPSGVHTVLNELRNDPNSAVSQAALDALIGMLDIRSLRKILGGDRYPAEARRSIAERLVGTTGGALVLLRLIDEDRLSPELTRAIVAKASTHPDANVRVLFEKFIPPEQRPKKLGKEITADQILAIAGDAERGRQIFFKSSAAQCNACHAVQGFGSTIGPELSKIGAKYERRALLETILDPSKAIAPEYVPYVLVTKDGRVFAGFLVERADDHVVVKDIKNQQIRVAADDIEALVEQQTSLMPQLVLSEVTAQDAADLLEFLTTQR